MDISLRKYTKCKICDLQYTKLKGSHCRLCNMVHNIKPYYINELILCYSKYNQITIIKKTVEFILKYKRNPLPNEIDFNVKLVNLPLYKYDKDLKHKIFVTNLFKNSYIIKTHFGDGYYHINNYNPEEYLFNDTIINLQNK